MRPSDFLPKQLQQALERPSVVRFFARWAIGVGALVELFVIAMAVSYFLSPTSFRDTETGLPAAPANVLGVLFALGCGGVFCIVRGLRRLRRSSDLN